MYAKMKPESSIQVVCDVECPKCRHKFEVNVEG